MIITCSWKQYSDIEVKIYLDPLRSELCYLLQAMTFYVITFMIFPVAFHIFCHALINTVINFFQGYLQIVEVVTKNC